MRSNVEVQAALDLNDIVHYVSSDLYACLISFFLKRLKLFIIVTRGGKGVSQRGKHKQSSHSNLSQYLIESLTMSFRGTQGLGLALLEGQTILILGRTLASSSPRSSPGVLLPRTGD